MAARRCNVFLKVAAELKPSQNKNFEIKKVNFTCPKHLRGSFRDKWVCDANRKKEKI